MTCTGIIAVELQRSGFGLHSPGEALGKRSSLAVCRRQVVLIDVGLDDLTSATR
jgi:hypothetical protein